MTKKIIIFLLLFPFHVHAAIDFSGPIEKMHVNEHRAMAVFMRMVHEQPTQTAEGLAERFYKTSGFGWQSEFMTDLLELHNLAEHYDRNLGTPTDLEPVRTFAKTFVESLSLHGSVKDLSLLTTLLHMHRKLWRQAMVAHVFSSPVPATWWLDSLLRPMIDSLANSDPQDQLADHSEELDLLAATLAGRAVLNKEDAEPLLQSMYGEMALHSIWFKVRPAAGCAAILQKVASTTREHLPYFDALAEE